MRAAVLFQRVARTRRLTLAALGMTRTLIRAVVLDVKCHCKEVLLLLPIRTPRSRRQRRATNRPRWRCRSRDQLTIRIRTTVGLFSVRTLGKACVWHIVYK